MYRGEPACDSRWAFNRAPFFDSYSRWLYPITRRDYWALCCGGLCSFILSLSISSSVYKAHRAVVVWIGTFLCIGLRSILLVAFETQWMNMRSVHRTDGSSPMTLFGLIMGRHMNPCLAAIGQSGKELVITLIAISILYCAKRIPDFVKGLRRGVHGFREACDEAGFDLGQDAAGSFGKPAAEALTVENQTTEFYDPPALRDVSRNVKDEQKQIRPTLRLLGWILICVVLLALIACLFAEAG